MVFASCWTASEGEMIELWSLYTNLNGVRVGLPIKMFPFTDLAHSDSGELNQKQISWGDLTADQKQKLMLRRRRSASPSPRGQPKELYYALNEIWGPEPIIYVDPSQREVRVFDTEKRTYDVSELGLRKNSVWGFEMEVRFQLIAIRSDAASRIDPEIAQWRKQNKLDLPLEIFTPRGFKDWPVASEYLYVPLSDSALTQIEITLAPRAEEAQRILVSALCQDCLGYLPPIRQSDVNLRRSG